MASGTKANTKKTKSTAKELSTGKSCLIDLNCAKACEVFVMARCLTVGWVQAKRAQV